MYYAPKHAAAPKTPSPRTRAIGVGVTSAATIAVGVALSAPAQASSGSVWDRVAACESGGNWSISTGNGFYGGLQFTRSTWLAYGGGAYASSANYASRSAQIAVAQRVLAGQGPGAWPVCSIRAGLTRGNGGASGASSSYSSSSRSSTRHYTSSTHRHYTTTTRKPTTHFTVKRSTNHVSSAPAVRVSASGHSMVVRSGDWLSKIASRYAVRGGWQAIWALNRATVKNPNLIFVGQRLQLPR